MIHQSTFPLYMPATVLGDVLEVGRTFLQLTVLAAGYVVQAILELVCPFLEG